MLFWNPTTNQLKIEGLRVVTLVKKGSKLRYLGRLFGDYLRLYRKNRRSAGNKKRKVRRVVYKLSYPSYDSFRFKSTNLVYVDENGNDEIKEDINKAIEYLIKAGKNVYCPFCRAKIVHLVDYFLRYHYKTLLVESGVSRDKLDEVFGERYENVVRRRVEEVKKTLKVSDYDIKETSKDLGQLLLGGI